MGYYEQLTSQAYESSSKRRSGRHHRKRRRGYVIPLDFDVEGQAPTSDHRRRRRRRRHGMGSIEKFIGLSALWIMLVVGAVMFEAASGQKWFFIGEPDLIELKRDYVIFGEEALQNDSVFLPLGEDPHNEQKMIVSGDAGPGPEMKWLRVALVLISVPLSYVLYRVVRRLRRRRR